MADPQKLHVVLFCGGRGSKALISECMRRNDVHLTLLVNAYDDGLSTGALRRFIPGMLGPSDFRKNLSSMMDLYSTEQYALRQIIEYRLPVSFDENNLAGLQHYIITGETNALIEPLRSLCRQLSALRSQDIRTALRTFFDYYEKRAAMCPFDFKDCSVGNIIFAGRYLDAEQDFNKTIVVFAALLGIYAPLFNISQGESYTLAAIKQDGQLLINECSIVSPQSDVPIQEIYFISNPPACGWEALEKQSIEEKIAWLESHASHPHPSPEAVEALASADVIIYCPGTQHSSLLPSYRIVQAHLAASPAKIKAFVVNLAHDHDIQGLDAAALMDRALRYMGDPGNTGKSVTHIIYHHGPVLNDQVLFPEKHLTSGSYRNACILAGNFVNAAQPAVHNGYMTLNAILDMVEESGMGAKPALDIYLGLLKRSVAESAVIQEAIELPWQELFSAVTIHVSSQSDLKLPPLPAYMRIAAHNRSDGEHMEADALRDRRGATYLAILSGDGEYRLADVLGAAKLMKRASFGVVFGSRAQSRRQFLTSIRLAYGEGTLLYILSWLGALLVTALIGMRFSVIFSDPLTGFHVYRRDRIAQLVESLPDGKRSITSVEILRILLRANVEIAELPVTYKTFSGFTSPGWRLRRGLKSLLSFFR